MELYLANPRISTSALQSTIRRLSCSTLTLGVIAFAMFANPAETISAELPSEPTCKGKGRTVWHLPIHDSDIGKSPFKTFSRSEYNLVGSVQDPAGRFAVAKSPDGATALKANVWKGENERARVAFRAFDGDGISHACLTFRIYFSKAFDFATAGTKLAWGLWGGNPTKNSGGIPPKLQEGWTVRNVTNRRGSAIYSYHLNRDGKESDNKKCAPYRCMFGVQSERSSSLSSGKWIELALEVKVNDRGKANGFAKFWVDGQLQGDTHGMILRDERNWLIRGLWLTDMWGGKTSDPKNYSPTYQAIWYNDYRIADLSGSGDVIIADGDLGDDESTSSDLNDDSDLLSLVQIAPIGEVASNNLYFSWKPSDIAKSFSIVAKRNSDGAVVFQKNVDRDGVYCNQSNEDCIVDGPALDPGRYRWSIKQYARVSNKGFLDNSLAQFAVVSGAFDNSEPSQTVDISADNITFSAPSGSIDGDNLILKWNEVDDADKYYVKIVGKGDQSHYIFGKSIYPHSCGNEGGRCQIVGPQLPKGSYVWMVRPVIGSEKQEYVRKDILVS